MVNIHVNDNNNNQIRINVPGINNTVTTESSNPNNNVSSTIGNETFYNGLAKEWAISPELVQGEDHSAKYYAGQAKQAEQTATEAISNIGTSVEDAAGYAQSAQSSAEYVVNNAPTVTVEQTATGAIVTATDLQGTTTATILNGAKGDKGDTGSKGDTGAKGDKGDTGFSPTATVSKSGKVSTLTVTDLNGTTTTEILDGADGGYTLPIASSNTLGGIKVGSNLSIDADGVLSATASGTVDQTFDGTSANAQSGVAIEGELITHYVKSSAEDTSQGMTSSIGYLNGIYPAMQMTQGNYQFIITTAGGAALGAIDNTTHSAVAFGATPNGVDILQGTQQALLTLSSNNNLVVNNNELATQDWVTNQGYTTNTGTVTSVNNVQPVNGNVTLSIPTATSDLTNDSGFITSIPTATSGTLGIVQPDNTTITIDSNGVISSNGASRNVGEVITSTLPLTDAGLHLLDGTLLQYGIYKEFIDYIADLYENTSVSWETYIQPTNPSGITSTSGFSNPSNAFDNNASTYASCGTTTDYIEWDLGQTLKISGFNASISWKSGSAASCNLAIYSVDDNNNETLLANGSGVAQGASGTTSASFSGIEVNKLRFKCIPNDGGQSLSPSTPSHIVQINIIAQREVKPIFCTESEWQQSVNTYGSCGKFVYDSVSKTVRLPKISDILQSTTDINALGDLIEAGLPNITGDMNGILTTFNNTYNFSGAISSTGRYNNDTGSEGSNRAYTGNLNINASRSSSIYGNSTTVQPQTIKAFVYIVIANSTKTSIQVDIDEIATDLNNKAGTDLANVTDTGKILMSGMGMPSDTYVDLTLGASGSTYTAPANGYVCLNKTKTSQNQYIAINRKSKDSDAFEMGVWSNGNPAATSGMVYTYLPAKKDDLILIDYSAGGAVSYFRFIYAQGSKN